ncbi:MAG TPA: hypothetical protein VIG88_11925 [Lysobacter sp.]
MHATTDSDRSAKARRDAGEARRVRVEARDLYEFRRYHYADGWDDDDAALGWVDAEIVSGPRRRTVH